ncbi:MAG TPA: hypothetical protein VMT62_17575 [Syntrophorhabdaceae bacterium]|nr:hypothetical protein [Syntrophorhabdaceae bacterium]
MKRVICIIVSVFFAVFLSGCERMETAVDTYKKVKDDAKKKSGEAEQQAGAIVSDKLKDKLEPPDISENGKEGNRENTSQ